MDICLFVSFVLEERGKRETEGRKEGRKAESRNGSEKLRRETHPRKNPTKTILTASTGTFLTPQIIAKNPEANPSIKMEKVFSPNFLPTYARATRPVAIPV